MSKFLSNAAHSQLCEWLQSKGFPTVRMGRYFANGIHAAELLKLIRPELINLQNYAPCNCLRRKLINWEFLNRNCLRKLGFKLSQNDLLAFAAGETDQIQTLLYQFMLSNYTKEVDSDVESDISKDFNQTGDPVPHDISAVHKLKRSKEKLEAASSRIKFLMNRIDTLSDTVVGTHRRRSTSNDSRNSRYSRH